jgi:hypothetical protein
MSNARRFQLDELTLRPGTYFNPQTEILIVVDDSPEVDHEIFERQEFGSADWVLISDDAPLDENKRDDLIERFQISHQPGSELLADEDHDLDEDEQDADDDQDADGFDELDGVDDDLELDRE